MGHILTFCSERDLDLHAHVALVAQDAHLDDVHIVLVVALEVATIIEEQTADLVLQCRDKVQVGQEAQLTVVVNIDHSRNVPQPENK